MAKRQLRSAFVNWQVVVDNNRSLKSIDVKVELVNTSTVHGFCFEKIVNVLGVPCYAAEHGNEVAVANPTLPHVIRINFVRKDYWLFKQLRDPPPLQPVSVEILICGICFLEEGAQNRWEVWISPSLSLLNDFVHVEASHERVLDVCLFHKAIRLLES